MKTTNTICCPRSPVMLVNGSTAMAGRSGSGRLDRPRGLWPARCRRRLLGSVRLNTNGGDEPQSLARPCGLIFGVCHRRPGLSGRIDPAGQGRVRHDPATPDRRDEILLAHHAVAIFHQMNRCELADELAGPRVNWPPIADDGRH
jgi:hypothetical protein